MYKTENELDLDQSRYNSKLEGVSSRYTKKNKPK